MKLFLKNIYYRFYIILRFGKDENDSSFLSIFFIAIIINIYLFMLLGLLKHFFLISIAFNSNKTAGILITIECIALLMILHYFINYKKKYKKIIIDCFINETAKETTKYSWWFGLFLAVTILTLIGWALLIAN